MSLKSSDYSALSLNSELGTSLSDTWAIVSADATVASDGLLGSTAILDGSAIPCTKYTIDTLGPAYQSWSIDMDNGLLTLAFGEPVRASSFSATGINFQRVANLGNIQEADRDAESISLSDTGVTVTSVDGMVQTISLGDYNMNLIKALSPLGTSQETIFFSVSAAAIADMNGNAMSLAYLSVFEGHRSLSFTPDTTAPEIAAFELDMDVGFLRLTFTETVNVFQMEIWQVNLQEYATAASGTAITFAPTTVAQSTDPASVVTFTLGEDDMNAIKLLDMKAASSSSTTFMTFSEEFTKDLSAEQFPIVARVDATSPAVVTTFTADTTQPIMLNYELNMDARTFTVTFTEAVRASSLTVQFFTFQDDPSVSTNGGDAVALTASSTTSSPNGITLVIDLGDSDFNALKMSAALALSASTTFLRYVDSGNVNAVSDMIVPPNYLAEVTDGSTSNPTLFTPDSSDPSLVSFDMDMNSGLLTLTMSEPCDASTLTVTSLHYQSSQVTVTCNAFGICSVAGADASAGYSLTVGSSFAVDADSTVLYVNVGVDDLNGIKISDSFFSSAAFSFLGISAGMVYDIADFVQGEDVLSQNPAAAIDLMTSMQVTTFTRDVTPPALMQVALDMDAGYLDLTFDEPVRASTFDPTGVTLHSVSDVTDATAAHVSHTLSSDAATYSPNGLTLTVLLSYDDENALKSFTGGFTAEANTYVATTASAVQDMAANGVAMADNDVALAAYLHTADGTKPNLISYDFDPVNFLIRFFFDEPMDPDSFNPAGLAFQESATAATINLILEDALCSPGVSRVINCNFGDNDKATFAALNGKSFLTGIEDTFLTLAAFTFDDVAVVPNEVVPITSSRGIGPALFRATLDMDEGIIVLRFSEPVRSEAFEATTVTIQNRQTSPTISFTLTGDAGASELAYGYTLSVTLSPADLAAIKITPGLATKRSDSYISLAPACVTDTKLTSDFIGVNPSLPTSPALLVREYVVDATAPNLLSWSLDLSAPTLTLNFDEPVKASTLGAAQIELHNQAASGGSLGSFVALTSGSTTASADGTTLIVDIEMLGGDGNGDGNDFDEIGYARDVAVSLETSFITFTTDLVVDMSTNLNKVEAVTSAAALQASSFTADVTAPTLQSFAFDLDAKTITLTFSETVFVDSPANFDVTEIALQSAASGASYTHTLSTQSTVSSSTISAALLRSVPASPVVVIDIGQQDIDAIKALSSLATASGDTYVALGAALTTDISVAANAVAAVESTAARQVTSYTADSSSPSLLEFTFDANSGVMNFEFDEVVDISSFDPTKLQLQYALFVGDRPLFVALAGGTVANAGVPSRLAEVALTTYDQNAVKLISSVCTSASDCFLTFATTLLTDMAGNGINVVKDGEAVVADGYVDDARGPFITSFQLMKSGNLVLKFSESMLTSSFVPSAFVLQNADGTNAYSLTASTTITATASQSTVITFDLASDFTAAENRGLALDQMTSYMSCSDNGMTDVAGNRLTAISSSNALLMGPALDSFSLDMQSEELTLNFSEELTGNIAAAAITIASEAASTPSHFHTLTAWGSGSFAITGNALTATLPLSGADVESLKANGFLAVSAATTYLSIGSSPALAFNSDTESVGAPLFVVPLATGEAASTVSFTADTSSPTLDSFDLDKNSGVLTLSFDEPVELSSFNVSSFYLQADVERGTSLNFVNLDSGSAFTDPNGWSSGIGIGATEISITLNGGDLGKVLSLNLGQYLVMDATAARDTADLVHSNSVLAIVDGSAQQVNAIVPDSTSPTVVGFTLNMEEGSMTIEFSEPVDSASFDPSGVTIQGTLLASASASYTFTDATIIASSVGNFITLDMLVFRTDLEGIKSILANNVAVDASTSLLTIDGSKFEDYSGNDGASIVDGSAITASAYVQDTRKPELLSWDMEVTATGDPTYKQVTLHFSEPVSTSSLIIANFRITDTPSDTAPFNRALTLSTVSSGLGSSRSSITVTLHDDDVADIVSAASSSFFISVLDDSAYDTSGNKLDALSYLQIGPVLLFSTVSMETAEIITLVFSETVDISTMDVTGISVFSSDGLETYTLTSGSALTATPSNTNIVRVLMSPADVDEIKKLQNLCVSAETCRIGLADTTVEDTAATPNKVVPIIEAGAVAVSGFSADATAPTLTSITVDLQSDFIEFSFDEPIVAESVALTQISFQSAADVSTALGAWKLNATNFAGTNDVTIRADLAFVDMVAIKSDLNLCISAGSCFTTFLSDTFLDAALAPNTVDLIRNTAAVQVDHFIADDVAPSLASFELNLDIGVLTLMFSEPVQLSTFLPSSVGIQKLRSSFSDGILLDAASTTVTPHHHLGHILSVTLTAADLDLLLLNSELASDRFTTYLSIANAAVKDTSGNDLTAISQTEAQFAAAYTADTTLPTLSTVGFDLNLGQLSLTFSELVDINNVDVTSIGVYNTTGASATGVTLDAVSVLAQTTVHTANVLVNLSPASLDAVKDLTILGTENANTWVKLGGAAVLDLSGNANAEIESDQYVASSAFVADSTSPELVKFSMDMDSGTLTLEFTETIDESFIDWSLVRLHEYELSKFGTVFSFISPVVSAGSAETSNILHVSLGVTDMASLKEKEIGTAAGTIWLSMFQGAFRDMSGLGVVNVLETGIKGGKSLAVSSLVLDNTGPAVVRWRIDRTGEHSNVLVVYFSEPVTVNSDEDRNRLSFSNSELDSVQFHLGTNARVAGEGEEDGYAASYVLRGEGALMHDTVLTVTLTEVLPGGSETDSIWDQLELMDINRVLALNDVNPFSLSLQEGVVRDLSPTKNANEAQQFVQEDVPVCSCEAEVLSGRQQYISAACSSLNDAVCAPCTDCSSIGQLYAGKQCGVSTDTECVVCSSCEHGFYPSGACSASSDTVCSTCTTCPDTSYETEECSGGVNRMCASCNVCTWQNSDQEAACNGKQRQWQTENCCFDKKGNNINCKSVDRVNMLIEARRGRHHWVYRDTTPAVGAGYELGEWNGD